jgi:hypothetical protein
LSMTIRVLLDLLASSPEPPRVRELPYSFRERQHDESKLDTMVAWEYGMLLADKLVGRFVPVRFALFGLIGGLGLVVHLATLCVALNLLVIEFSASQAIATMVAMTSNFVLNNQFTYRDQRLRGLKTAARPCHFLLDLRDRGDRQRRRRLLRVHLEPHLVACRRGGYRLGLEFRDVLRLHLAPLLNSAIGVRPDPQGPPRLGARRC